MEYDSTSQMSLIAEDGCLLSSTPSRGNHRPNILLKSLHISSLDVDCPRALETANEALSSLPGSHEATASLFNFVVHVPRYQVAIVDHMLLSRLQLYHKSQRCPNAIEF